MTTTIPEVKAQSFFGSLKALRDDPFGFTVNIASHGDMVKSRIGPFSIYIASNPDVVHDLLIKQRENIVKSPQDMRVLGRFLGRGLLTNEGNAHKHQRKLVQPAFLPKRIQSYADTMVRQSQAAFSNWYDGLIVDIDQTMTRLTLDIVAQTLFSATISADEAERIAHAMDVLQVDVAKLSAMVIAPPTWLPLAINRRVKRATAVIDRIVWRVIRERRANPRDTGDLLSMLLLTKDEQGNGMSDQQVRDEVITLILAGHETTANALTWCVYALTQNPAVQAKLHAELDTVLAGRAATLDDLARLPYCDMVIKETLRLYPPAWSLTPRVTTQSIEIGGYQLPKNVGVLISPYLSHHDPRLWHEPDRFDPERFTPDNEAQRHKYAYIPFGAGNRVCIGNAFALMEARLILATLAQRFSFTLDPSQKVEYDPQITLGTKYGMRVRLQAMG